MYIAGQQTGKGQTSGQASQQTSREYDLAISQASPMPFPTAAIVDDTGEDVTLTHVCNWPGHSPSNVGVNTRGKQFIASFDELTVTDNRVLPNSAANKLRATLASS